MMQLHLKSPNREWQIAMSLAVALTCPHDPQNQNTKSVGQR